MNIRIYNARIFYKARVIFGELIIKDNLIFDVIDLSKEDIDYNTSYKTEAYESTKYRNMLFDREINANGNLILPGFKNAHTHSPMTFLRSFADDLPLLDWLEKQVFPMEAKLREEDVYHLTKLAIMEYLSSGITSNFEMYFHIPAIAKACVDTGFRTVFCSGINNFMSDIHTLEEEYLRFNEYSDLISYQLGFHAEYTCSKDLLEQIVQLARKYKAPVYSHLSESKKEVEECKLRHSKTPPKFLYDLGMYEYGGGGYHCIHFEEEDYRIFEEMGLYAVSNPASNLKLASGIADIKKFLDMNIPVALGTDGPASNNCLDMFREMFLMTGLAKYKNDDASCVPAESVLSIATQGGANAMGLCDADSIDIGKWADIIMIDLQKPNMQPINNIIKNLVYSGSKENVCMTMVNGKILYENGIYHIGCTKEEIYERANHIMHRMRENQ